MGDHAARSVELRGGLEVHTWTGRDRTPLVLLHEGLGSAGLWRAFPSELASRTARRTIAVSRRGHGRSAPLEAPHEPDYMHREAAELPTLLADVLDLDRAVLVGHSDGASIALLHAAAAASDSVAGLVLLAPHVIVEDTTIRGIEVAREHYLTSDLPDRMARHHDDADSLFWAWNDVWLSPAFRDWDITGALPDVTQPVLLVQCGDDQYGTLRQLDLIQAGIAGPSHRVVLPDGGHSPHLAHPDVVADAVTRFLSDLP